MKKLLSILIITFAFTFTTFAGDGHIDSPGATCVYGHIDSPGVKCAPPAESGNGSFAANDDSTFKFIINLITEFDPFGFFSN